MDDGAETTFVSSLGFTMNLIYYRGLNCHLASIVSIADALGVNYLDAFGTLWSETDFADDPKYHILLSRRVLPNLEALGVKIGALPCSSPQEAEASYLPIPEGELLLIGMDAFHIPWSPVYQGVHEPHYFFARKDKQDGLQCFDPVYNQRALCSTSGDIVPHAFELSRVRKLAAVRPRFSVAREAREVLATHPVIRAEIAAAISECKDKGRKSVTPLLKRITAMINNRYLFQRFLHQYSDGLYQRFSRGNFLAQWESVKIGICKASIISNNESLIDEACALFLELMLNETGMAKEMIATESGFC